MNDQNNFRLRIVRRIFFRRASKRSRILFTSRRLKSKGSLELCQVNVAFNFGVFAQEKLFGVGRGDKAREATDFDETFACAARIAVGVIDCQARLGHDGLFAAVGDKVQVQFDLRLVLAARIVDAQIFVGVGIEHVEEHVHEHGQIHPLRIEFNFDARNILQILRLVFNVTVNIFRGECPDGNFQDTGHVDENFLQLVDVAATEINFFRVQVQTSSGAGHPLFNQVWIRRTVQHCFGSSLRLSVQ